MNEATNELDALLGELERRLRAAGRGDAIDRILGGAPRTTQVRSLRDDEVVESFRRELSDGLIRVDTANKLLHFVSQVLAAVGPI